MSLRHSVIHCMFMYAGILMAGWYIGVHRQIQQISIHTYKTNALHIHAHRHSYYILEYRCTQTWSANMDAHTQNQRAAYEYTQTFILYIGILVYTNTVSEYGYTHTKLARCIWMYADKVHTEWRRPIGCLKLQVIFRERATNYRAFFWKMTYKDKASYDSTPPLLIRAYKAYSMYVIFRKKATDYRALLWIDLRRQSLLNVRQIRKMNVSYSLYYFATLLRYYVTTAQAIALGESFHESHISIADFIL